MATVLQPQEDYLLVSDSNEVSSQFDSKKLKESELVNLVQNNLFRGHLTMMDRYLTKNHYQNYSKLVDQRMEECVRLYNGVKNLKRGRLRVQDGQVILLEKDSTDRCIGTGNGQFTTIEDYIKNFWYIPSDYYIKQIQGCMLRGMTEVRNDIVQFSTSQKVELNEENIPNHMHHSSITKGAKVESMKGNQEDMTTGVVTGGTVYDMFYNDSFSTGVDKNEVQGVVDNFNVGSYGKNAGLYHNNMPAFSNFYTFVVHKMT